MNRRRAKTRTIYNDTNKGGTVSGTLTGTDVDRDAELTFGAAFGTPSGNPGLSDFVASSSTGEEKTKDVFGTFGTLTLKNDGTWTYTLKEDATLPEDTTATLDGKTFDIDSIDALPENATVTETFTFYVKDEYGAWRSETKTITITGTNDKPELTLKDEDGKVVSAPLETTEHDPDAPDASDTSTGWPEVGGTFEITDVDADAGSDQTLLIEGGSHTDGGKTYETTHVAGSAPQTGHIRSEGGTETSATFTTEYGTLTVKPGGSWTYEVNGDSPKVQELDPKNPHYETFKVTVVDEHGAYDTREIVIKLTGKSEPPTIETAKNLVFKEAGVYHNGSDGNTETTESDTVVGADGQVYEDRHSATTLTGQVTASDVDLGDQGEGKLTFSVKAKDAELTTNGVLDTAQPSKPVEGPSTDGTTVYESAYGTLTFHKNGAYTYELNSSAFDDDGNAVNKLAQGQVLTETFTVTVEDTFGKKDFIDITITIHGTNDKPTLSLSSGSGEGDGSLHVMESGVGRDADGNVVHGPDDEPLGGTDLAQDEVKE